MNRRNLNNANTDLSRSAEARPSGSFSHPFELTDWDRGPTIAPNNGSNGSLTQVPDNEEKQS
jgi:hypothetical protein